MWLWIPEYGCCECGCRMWLAGDKPEGVPVGLRDVLMAADCSSIMFRYCRYIRRWAVDGGQVHWTRIQQSCEQRHGHVWALLDASSISGPVLHFWTACLGAPICMPYRAKDYFGYKRQGAAIERVIWEPPYISLNTFSSRIKTSPALPD